MGQPPEFQKSQSWLGLGMMAVLVIGLAIWMGWSDPVQAREGQRPLSQESGGDAAAQRPFILPFADPPGPNSWLLGQPYGNTTGAYRNRYRFYAASQGIHFGIDLSAPCGTALIAMADGVVAYADNLSFGSAPHNLIIDHPDLGYSVLYGHLLQRPDLGSGQTVRQGEVVALSGDPAETCFGRPHLHLEIRGYPNRAIKYNPVPLIQADWDNLALAGPFSPGFQRDLDDPRKWQFMDDQPLSVSGGPMLNEFTHTWPPDRP